MTGTGLDALVTGPAYEVLTAETVASYVAASDVLRRLVDPANLSVRDVGDGNINQVFVCRDGHGRGLCLKQALPYVRIIGESWPLTPARAVVEAGSLRRSMAVSPEMVPELFAFDRDRFVIAMEDLSDWEVWRTALNRGAVHAGAASQIGRFVARTTFANSTFSLDGHEARVRAAHASNPAMCRITEDLVFTEPYIEHEHNSWVEELSPSVDALRSDAALRSEVGGLKYRFETQAQALIHGDLHTGSVMVKSAGGQGRAKVIDPEFSFFGPVGFDLGALLANYLIAYARAEAIGRPRPFVSWLEGLAAETWSSFAGEMATLWPDRRDRSLNDGFLEAWLSDVWIDALGFAGCKAIRRVVGLAKASDLESLDHRPHVDAASVVLRTARRWLAERRRIRTPAAAMIVARSSWENPE